jgi:hypothetical protein
MRLAHYSAGATQIESLIALCFRALGRHGLFKIRLCFIDGVYVPLWVDEGNLPLGLHTLHLCKQTEINPVGTKKYVAWECTLRGPVMCWDCPPPG